MAKSKKRSLGGGWNGAEGLFWDLKKRATSWYDPHDETGFDHHFALAVTVWGAGLTLYFLSEAHWLTGLLQLGLFAALLFCVWCMLRVFLALERKHEDVT